ncbi:unnamed protein product [Urochloa humidicola]
MDPAAGDIGVPAPHCCHGGAVRRCGRRRLKRQGARQPPFPEATGGSRSQERRCNLPQPRRPSTLLILVLSMSVKPTSGRRWCLQHH